jgi:hypothetical protein
MRFLIRSLAALVLAAGVSAAAEDLTIVSKRTHDGKPSDTTTSYLASDHVRIAQDEGRETIVDMKTGQMTVLDGKKKTYYVITRQDMEQLKAKMAERMNSPEMKQAQEKMKNLPPEVQKKMDAMMGGAAGAFDVQKTGTTRKVAGYTCENWTISMGQFSKSEECITSELQLPAQAWDTYREFAESMKGMMSAMGPMAKNMAQMQEKLKDMKGFPLANSTTVNIMGHSSASTSEAIEVKRAPIPASAWEIPAGYAKTDNPMLKALQSPK